MTCITCETHPNREPSQANSIFGSGFFPVRRIGFEVIESARIAGQQLLANRTRSFLTGLGVIIGIIAVTLMETAIKGIDTDFDRSMKMLGEDVFYIEESPWTPAENFWVYKNRPDIKPAMADRLN